MRQLSHLWKIVALATLVPAVLTSFSAANEPYQPSTPFIDPYEFDTDFQIFKPFDPDDYGGAPKPRIGWFLNFDRMYIAMSRPETGGTNGMAGQIIGNYRNIMTDNESPWLPGQVASEVALTPLNPLPEPVDSNLGPLADTHDFTYGNRLDFGFMTDENHGWLLSYIKVNNPHLALVNPNFTHGSGSQSGGDDEGDDQGGDDEGGEDLPSLPSQTGYGDVLGDYLQETKISINSGTFNSIELTKIFRLEQLNNGVVVEPMFGMRYIEFRDIFFADGVHFGQVWSISDGEDDGGGTTDDATGDDAGDTGTDLELIDMLELDTFNGFAKNQMMMGQLGFRAYQQRGRWNLGAEIRAFSGLNYQIFERTHRQEIQFELEDAEGGGGGDEEGEGGEGGEITVISGNPVPYAYVPVTLSREERDMTELVIGSEMRLNASYSVWRDVSINAGFELILVGRGVARGFDLNNDEKLMLVGGTLGIVVNR